MTPERITEIAAENLFKHTNRDITTWEVTMISAAIQEALNEQDDKYRVNLMRIHNFVEVVQELVMASPEIRYHENITVLLKKILRISADV